jgi:hypothetical protein
MPEGTLLWPPWVPPISRSATFARVTGITHDIRPDQARGPREGRGVRELLNLDPDDHVPATSDHFMIMLGAPLIIFTASLQPPFQTLAMLAKRV